MGRSFAGVLALTAFTASVLRGVLAGHAPESVLLTATILLFVFAAGGWIVGSIAESTIDQSVRVRFEAELKAAEADKIARSTGKT
jgi:hypothetical protein